MTGVSEIVVILSSLLVFVLVRPVTCFGGMEAESASLCIYMIGWITVVKPLVWTLSFIPAYGMAGRRGRAFFYGNIHCDHVAFPGDIVYRFMSLFRFWPDGCLDWNVHGLDRAGYCVHPSVFQR